MSEKKTELKAETPMAVTFDQLTELVKAIKIDPEKEAEKEAKKLAREDYEKREAAEREGRENRYKYCLTGHKKQDRIHWNVAWMLVKKVAVGYCSVCETTFEPGHPQYNELRMNSAFTYDLSPIG